jgi:hypothetical protein
MTVTIAEKAMGIEPYPMSTNAAEMTITARKKMSDNAVHARVGPISLTHETSGLYKNPLCSVLHQAFSISIEKSTDLTE